MAFWGNIFASLAYCKTDILAGQDVMPRFLVQAPDGTHTLFPMLDVHDEERASLFLAIRSFMIWKGATSFVLVMPTDGASMLSLYAVSRSQVVAASQTYEHSPSLLNLWRWLGSEAVHPSYVALLAPKEVVVTAEEFNLIQALESGRSMPNLIVGRSIRERVFSAWVEVKQ